MPFEKGNPGRPKGSVHKVTKELRQSLEDHDFNLAEAMLDIYRRAIKRSEEGGKNDAYFLGAAADILKELASYYYPRPKPIHRTLSELSDDDFCAEAQRRLDERNKHLGPTDTQGSIDWTESDGRDVREKI